MRPSSNTVSYMHSDASKLECTQQRLSRSAWGRVPLSLVSLFEGEIRPLQRLIAAKNYVETPVTACALALGTAAQIPSTAEGTECQVNIAFLRKVLVVNIEEVQGNILRDRINSVNIYTEFAA